MQGRNFIRMFFFVVFFSVGAASLAISILCDDLVDYYRNKRHLILTQQSNKRLKSWIEDYDAVLEQREKDPNLVKRLAPAVLGTDPEDPNAVYPRATPEQLDKARQALTQDPNDQSAAPTLPNWLNRCSEPRRRTTLFIAGSFLILISFSCFTPTRQSMAKKKR